MTGMTGESLLEKKYKEKEYDWLIELAKKNSVGDTPSPAVNFYAGLAHADKKETEEAVVRFKRALELKPDYKEAMRAYCWHINDDTEQLRVLEKMFRLDYAGADDLCLMGEIYFERGFLQDAHYWYHEALKKEPQHWIGLTNLASLYVRLAMIYLQSAENSQEADLTHKICDNPEIESILRIIYDKHINKVTIDDEVVDD